MDGGDKQGAHIHIQYIRAVNMMFMARSNKTKSKQGTHGQITKAPYYNLSVYMYIQNQSIVNIYNYILTITGHTYIL